jgi:hypothetical protein
MEEIQSPKSKFAPMEDALLIKAVRARGPSDWTLIATLVPGRNARQCRERWNNYVNPDLTHATWTEADDRLLLQKFAEFGSKWHLISGFFTGRGKNAIRNRFLTLERRTRRAEMEAARRRVKLPEPRHSIPASEDIAEVAALTESTTQDPLAFLDVGFQECAITWRTEGDGDAVSHFSFF